MFQFIKVFSLLGYNHIAIIFSGDKNSAIIKAGKSLCNLLEASSPTFIKFGQLISHRPDILPKQYVEQLLSLTDNTQPISFELIQKKINNSLENYKVEIIEIDKKPLGSASIAQVHKVLVKLDDGTHRWEAWKVQKGEIKKVFERDLRYLRIITRFLDFTRLLPPIDHLAQEYEVWLKEETDFENEGRNLEKASLQCDFVPIIPTKVIPIINSPKLFGCHKSLDGVDQLLRMEFIDGLTLNKILALDYTNAAKKEILDECLTALFVQFLIYGFCHADPHISNLIWVEKEKKLYFVDFGLARDFSSVSGLHLIRMFRGFLIGKKDLCYSGLFGLLSLSPESEFEIIPELNSMFEGIQGKHKINIDSPYLESGSTFLVTLMNIVRKHKLKIRTESSAMFKAFATLDAVFTTVYPQYTIKDMMEVIIDISQLFVQRMILNESQLVVYFLNTLDQNNDIRQYLLQKIQTELGQDISAKVLGKFIKKPEDIINSTEQRNELFDALEQLENIFLASQTKNY